MLQVPGYSTIIKQPMDLGTVKRRVNQGSYPTPEHAWADILLVRALTRDQLPEQTLGRKFLRTHENVRMLTLRLAGVAQLPAVQRPGLCHHQRSQQHGAAACRGVDLPGPAC